MKKTTIVDLIAYTTQLNPAQRFDEYTPVAWHDVLGDMEATFEQCRAAVAAVAQNEQWIYPSAIREELKTILRAANPPPRAAAIEAPSKYETYEDRSERIARNKAKVQAVLDEISAKKVREDPHEADIPESLRHAREVARQYKRNRDARPEVQPTPLAGAVGTDPDRLVARFQTLREPSALPQKGN
jgi:hypothetical protein